MDWTASLIDMIRGAATFIGVLTVLVVVHEFGHFIVARMFGIKVYTFAVFMGGLRKTDLFSRLPAPIAPTRQVYLVGLAGLALIFIGFVLKAQSFGQSVGLAGLVISGLILPVWVVGRLEKLYHLEPTHGYRAVGYGAAAILAMLLFSKAFSTFSPTQIVAALSSGVWMGVIWTYYAPLRQKVDEDRIGKGSLNIGDEVVPVDYKPLLGMRTKSGMDLALLLIPAGGFVSLAGMNVKEDGSEVTVPGGIYSVAPWKRFLVLAAGPFFSLLLGVLLLFIGNLSMGEAVPTTVIKETKKGTPIDLAGLVANDKIVAINGTKVSLLKDLKLTLVTAYQANPKAPVKLDFLRNDQPMSASVIPTLGDPQVIVVNDTVKTVLVPILGFTPKVEMKPVPPDVALADAVMAPIETVRGLTHTVSHPSEAKNNVGGAISVANQATEVSRGGLGLTMAWAGLLSCSLGIMNLLPIFPLDGGQMLLALVEMFRRGRRLSYEIQTVVANVGAAMVFCLIVSVLLIDFSRLGQNKTVEKDVPVATPSDFQTKPKH